LEQKEHVRIKESGIPGAGLGLYTTKARRNNERIAKYGDQPYVDHNPRHKGEYVLQVKQNPPTYVNPFRTTASAGRFANEAKHGDHRRNNAGLGYSNAHHEAFLKAKGGIPAGREVLTTYGANSRQNYWGRNHS